MQPLVFGTTSWYGVDDEGDAITRLDCGHLLGFPLEMIQAVAAAGDGLELRHTPCGIKTWIEPEHVVELAVALTDAAAQRER